ncbi:DUF72 domain-containing protein [Olivibacter sp. CPCC 100613]|uniref:DUF72 domain-containing protein n=1 Tax=Olivibacter sp. CPCC 100613 TaxID=3079931 RepID=UPI002FF6672A
MKKGKIHIGTSGWHYKHWNGTFYPKETKDADQLNEYIKTFRTVELNNSFYRLPDTQTFINWKNKVPDDFLFSVKGSRYITHMKKLKVAEDAITELLDHAGHLEHKLGPILFQLPPKWELNSQRLSSFLEYLPKKYRYTFEFRNHSWYKQQVYDLLKKHHCAFCIYELAGHLSPLEETADFVYVRLHGPGDKYQGKYNKSTLKKWAERSKDWKEAGKDVFIYFDNDQLGYAAFNAQELIDLLSG